MANRYWVTGGTGNWNSTTNWSTASGGASGASVPGSSDAALLDASSGAGTVTLDISPTIQTLTCTGFTGTLAFGTNTISLNSTGTIFTGATTMTVTGTPLIICTNSSATARTVIPSLVTESNSISFRVTAGTGTFTLSTTPAVRDLDFTDGVNPTGYAGALTMAVMTVYGNFKASTGMTCPSSGNSITFAATSGTKTINTAGVTFDRPFTFNGVGGTWQLASALTSGATRSCTLTNGTLDLASYTLTTGLFSSSTTTARTLAFGTGKIVITGNNTTVFTTNTGTNLTVTGSKQVEYSYSGSTGTRQISGPTTATAIEGVNLCDHYITAGTDIFNPNSARWYGTIDCTGFGGTFSATSLPIYGNLVLSSVSTFVASASVLFSATSGTKTITSNGKTIDGFVTFNGIGGAWSLQDALTLGSTNTLTLTNGTLRLKAGATSTVGAFASSGTNQKFLQSTTPGSQATLSDASGTNSLSNTTIQDIAATGEATWNAFYQQGNVDAGNNTGWYFGETPTIGAEITMRLRSFTEPRRF